MNDKHSYRDDRERAAEYLSRVEGTLHDVAALDGELADAMRTARRLSAADYTSVTPGGVTSMVAAVDAAERRARAVADAVELLDGCSALLDALGGDYARLLRMRHVERMPWDAIARNMRYSVRQCHRLHADALAEFAAYLPGE